VERRGGEGQGRGEEERGEGRERKGRREGRGGEGKKGQGGAFPYFFFYKSSTAYTCIVLIKMDRYKKLTTQLYQCTCSFFFSYRRIAVEKRLKNVAIKR
jgi:hypothetical protein